MLVAIDQDYALSQTEHRRIRDAVASIPECAELPDLALTTTELREHVMAILQAHRDYQTHTASAHQLTIGPVTGHVAVPVTPQ